MADSIEEMLNRYREEFLATNKVKLYGLEISFYDVKDENIDVYSMSNDKYRTLTQIGYQQLPSILFAKSDANGSTRKIKSIKCSNPGADDDKYEYIYYKVPDEEFQKRSSSVSRGTAIKQWTKFYAGFFCGNFFYGAIEVTADFRIAVFGICSEWTKDFKAKQLRNEITQFLYQKGIAIAFERTRQALKDALSNATRAAISQVMARNLSHNIGSHVLSKFKSEAAINELPECITKEEDSTKDFQYKGKIPGIPQSKSQQIAYFNDYLKSRMDFLADVTMATPLLESTFKFCSGLLEGMLKNTVLLNRISGVSNEPNYSFVVKGVNPQTNEWPEYPSSESSNAYEHDYYSVAMPNDVLGCHAFYIILENIIRNTYKHSGSTAGINFYINIGPYRIPVSKDSEETKEADPDLLMIELYDDSRKSQANIDAIVNRRNEDFNREVLENGKIRSGGLGTIEMEVCAAYLRKIPLDDYTGEIYKLNNGHAYNEDSNKKIVPNIIRAFTHQWAEDCCSLGYRFFLLKPKELLIIGDGIAQGADWESKGIRILKETELYTKTFGHKLMVKVVEKAESATPVTEERRLSSFRHTPRTILITKERIDRLSGMSAEEILQNAWEWYEEVFTKAKGAFKFSGGKNRDFQLPEQTQTSRIVTAVTFDNHSGGSIDNEYITASHHVYGKMDTDTNSEVHRRNKIELAEMAATKVCIIDERIQDFTSKEAYSGTKDVDGQTKTYKVRYRHYFERIGVFIPAMRAEEAKEAGIYSSATITDGNRPQGKGQESGEVYWPEVKGVEEKETVNLNLASFGEMEDADSVQKRLKEYLAKKSDCDFIIIHLGILEKMETDKSAKGIEKKLCELLGNDETMYGKVIITSGRGTPDNVPIGCRYLPLSAVQHCVETNFDKYLLVQALFNARLPK